MANPSILIAFMFHSKDGLFFSRLEHGQVKIVKTNDGQIPNDSNRIFEVTLKENEWASVICSMSDPNETYNRWMSVRRFHTANFSLTKNELNSIDQDLTSEEREWMNAPMGDFYSVPASNNRGFRGCGPVDISPFYFTRTKSLSEKQ